MIAVLERRRQLAIIKSVMEQMEKMHFTKEEADAFADALKRDLKANNERFENEKPFVMHDWYRNGLLAKPFNEGE